MKNFLFIALFPISLAITSCEYEKWNSSGSKSNCDSVNVTYNTSVKPIFARNCYSCHSTAITSQTGGFDLEDIASLKDYLKLSYDGDGVYGSKFLHTIDQQGSLLYMPPTYKMTSCELTIISKWVKAGAP